jgi:hypothetical protein
VDEDALVVGTQRPERVGCRGERVDVVPWAVDGRVVDDPVPAGGGRASLASRGSERTTVTLAARTAS